MEKNRIRPVKVGNGVRMSYAHQGEVLEMPNLIEVQTNSYKWFLEEGLKEVFQDISPISDFGGHLSLEFVDFKLCREESKYDIDQCKERDATYAAPLKVPRGFTTRSVMIRLVRSYSPPQLSRTAVHGWSMRRILMMSSSSALIETEKYQSLYFCVH